jgi:hypothetical protein
MIGPDAPVAKLSVGVTLAAVEGFRIVNCSRIVNSASNCDDSGLNSVGSLQGTLWFVGGSRSVEVMVIAEV